MGVPDSGPETGREAGREAGANLGQHTSPAVGPGRRAPGPDAPDADAAPARGLRLASALARHVGAFRGLRRGLVAIVAGLVSVLAMAPFFLWPLLLATLPVLVWLIDSAADTGRGRRPLLAAFASGWCFGFGYFLGGLFWIGEAFLVEADVFAWLLPFAVTLLPAGLAIFYGAAAALARAFWVPGILRVLVLAVALSVAEWLRGHVLTGFPWNTLGYALTADLVSMQSAALVGIYGLTLVAVVVGAGPVVALADGEAAGRMRRAAVLALSLALVPLALQWTWGAWRLASGPAPMVDGARLRIVQPSIPQREKWRPDKQREIFLTHLSLSRVSDAGRLDDLEGITHVVWPEASMPFLPLSTPEAIEAIAELLPSGTQLLAGALRVAEPSETGARRQAFNSLMVFADDGRLAALYDKIHLVPFGEYLPFQSTLESIGLEQLTRMRGGFSIGPEPRPLLRIAGLPPVGALICYEAVFPAAVVQGRERPGLLVNVTNDGWFGNTTGPRQHFHQSRVRAVEEGLPLVRSANNGISALFDAEGRILARLDLDVRGVADTPVPVARPPTPYARLGDLPFLGMVLVSVMLVATSIRRAAIPVVDAGGVGS